jgi:hypothetical protein
LRKHDNEEQIISLNKNKNILINGRKLYTGIILRKIYTEELYTGELSPTPSPTPPTPHPAHP